MFLGIWVFPGYAKCRCSFAGGIIECWLIRVCSHFIFSYLIFIFILSWILHAFHVPRSGTSRSTCWTLFCAELVCAFIHWLGNFCVLIHSIVLALLCCLWKVYSLLAKCWWFFGMCPCSKFKVVFSTWHKFCLLMRCFQLGAEVVLSQMSSYFSAAS